LICAGLFEPKKEDVIDWKQLRNEELHDPSNVGKVMKLRKMR